MTCFDDIISIKGTSCGDTTPTSGLYLDMLGVNMSFLNDIVNDSYADSEALLDEKITFSTKKIVHDVVAHFADKFRANTIIDGERIGYFNENLQSVAAEAYLKGMRIELCNMTSFADLFISDITLHTNFTGNISVLVYDLIQNKLLDTLTCATVAGETSQTIVNKTYKSNRKKLNIILVYDATAISSYKTQVKSGGCADCAGGLFPYMNSYVRAAGVKILAASSKILDNTTSVSDTAWMSINYSLQCSNTDWLCTHVNLLAMPILYFTAAELMSYAISTPRQNSTTILDLETLQKRKEEYEAKYFDSINNVLKNIKLPKDDLCFECNLKSKHIFIAP